MKVVSLFYRRVVTILRLSPAGISEIENYCAHTGVIDHKTFIDQNIQVLHSGIVGKHRPVSGDGVPISAFIDQKSVPYAYLITLELL